MSDVQTIGGPVHFHTDVRGAGTPSAPDGEPVAAHGEGLYTHQN